MSSTPRHRLHPEFALRFASLPHQGRKALTEEESNGLRAPFGPPEEWDLTIDDRVLPGPGGTIPVRVYRPAADASVIRPALVWLHGGGWITGDLDMPEAHETARGVAGRADAVVVSVGYRLCGQDVHFPAPHDDVLAAYRWVREHSRELGVDPARIALGGASAGANLAAGAALRLRDEGETPWQALLLYPPVHAPLPEPSAELASALELLPAALKFEASSFVQEVTPIYLGGPADAASPYAFPGLAADLSGFPPTYLDHDEFDGLRGSGELFGAQLRAAGVQVEQVVSPGVLHGHLNIVGLGAAHATLDRMAARMRRPATPDQPGTRRQPTAVPSGARRQPGGSTSIERITPRRTKVGLVSGGLGTYWPQYPDLLPRLQASARQVAERLRALDCDLVDAGFISDAGEGARAAEHLRVAGCDLIVAFLPTYLTSSMLAPVAMRSGAPVLAVNLQPTAGMDHASFDTGRWLAYCGACPLPELANTFLRLGVEFRSVSGYLEDERAWARIARWVRAAGVRGALRTGRHGVMGHLYPGMLDVSTDLTLVPANFGGHVEVLEFDDLRVRVDAVTASDVARRMALAREVFELDDTVAADDFAWAAKVSLGLDRIVADFGLDSLAYYHRGLDGEQHERLGAGMILGASLLTARGVPAAGEYEVRTSLAMLVVDRLGGGGSFTELQALDFRDGVVEMGHDGPAHLAISSRRPLLRGLGTYHGKRGFGVSVEFDVRHGDVTVFGIAQQRDGSFRFVTSKGTVVDGPHLQIGNTTSRVDFGVNPGEWTDAWSATGISHHWALGVGDLRADIATTADLLGIECVDVAPAG